MISEEQLDQYRMEGTPVRVVRDGMEVNDVLGIVVAWDADSVVIRKRSRKVVKLSRSYIYEPVGSPRTQL
ncbi:hypothetical protein [Paenibacillus silvisoli]|uniref:hypothetical protein n=1 Tax=Paenibacillus silvisoli TaxID=3110539 RepID=UPI002805AE6F|nr:hypothetical protein [Paenibacillus silvisoli]